MAAQVERDTIHFMTQVPDEDRQALDGKSLGRFNEEMAEGTEDSSQVERGGQSTNSGDSAAVPTVSDSDTDDDNLFSPSSYNTPSTLTSPLHNEVFPPSDKSTSPLPPPPPPYKSTIEPSELPVSVPVPPPQMLRRRPSKPTKGILKPPTVQTSRFSFRRDILQPFNSRLAYSAYGAPSAPSIAPPIGAAVATAGDAFGTAAAVAGGFWGSALKRLSVVTNAAAGGPPPLRDLGEDVEPATTVKSSVSTSPTGMSSPTSPTGSHPPHLHSVLSSGPAPHTPARAHSTSSPVSASPYATIKASASPSAITAASPAPPQLSVVELKKVRFRMAALKVVYPINGPNGPLAPWEEGKTKKRINSEYRALRHQSQEGGESKGWNGESLLRLYSECCRTREEPGSERVRKALRENLTSTPKVLDLTNDILTHGAVETLADLLSVDFGLKKLILENSGLDDDSLKPLLHSLLVSGMVPTLSLANNKRIRSKGWKLIAIFTKKARFLRYLDLSDNNIDKKAAEYLVQALMPAVSPLPTTPTTPNSLSSTLPPSSLTQSSPAELSSSNPPPPNPEPETGDDVISEFEECIDDDLEPLFTVAPLLREDPSDAGTVLSLRLENCGLRNQALEALAHGVRSSALKHISIRRNRINALGAVSVAIMIRDYPIASDQALDTSLSHNLVAAASYHQQNGTFEPGNSVTARQALQVPYVRKPVISLSPTSSRPSTPAPISADLAPQAHSAHAEREAWANSEARNKLKRQIDELPRTGSLLTLDVKGNDIRNGVTYISQVLKRNRTLKVLNLSENKIDVQGMVSIAEALKYNSTLETLDMSLNPCCGPSLEGITTLRAAITINSNLKRIFLNSTDLTSEGAIALAEFLPEARSLLHLDLTGNFDIDIAGVMALSVSVKMNTTIRCLDINIPANDEDFARLSQEILQCCVRNTEIAQEESLARGNKVTISAPILKSAVARELKKAQDAEDRRSRKEEEMSKSKDEIMTAAEECWVVLSELIDEDERTASSGSTVTPSEVVKDLLVQAQLAEAQVGEAVSVTKAGEQRQRAIVVGEQLAGILDRAKRLYDKRPSSPIAPVASTPTTTTPNSFSIEDSDDEDSVSISFEGPSSSNVKGEAATGLVDRPSLPDIAIPPFRAEEAESPKSPAEKKSRFLTLEEGEVFRKGTALGAGEVDDEETDDVSGEDLRKELLHTEVQRSPRPSFGSSEDHPALHPY